MGGGGCGRDWGTDGQSRYIGIPLGSGAKAMMRKRILLWLESFPALIEGKSGPEFLSSLAFQTTLASVIFMKKSLLFILPLSPSFASTSLSPHLEKG